MAPLPVYKPIQTPLPGTITPQKTLGETITERLLKYGSLILKRALATQTGALIYEVPAGKTFFLVAASLNAENVSRTGSFSARLSVDPLQFTFSTSTKLLHITSSSASSADGNAVVSASYPIPLKFIEGFKFFAYDNPSSSGNSDGLIQGYEISNEFLK